MPLYGLPANFWGVGKVAKTFVSCPEEGRIATGHWLTAMDATFKAWRMTMDVQGCSLVLRRLGLVFWGLGVLPKVDAFVWRIFSYFDVVHECYACSVLFTS